MNDLDVGGSSRPVEGTDGLDEDAAEQLVVLLETIEILRRLRESICRGSSGDTRGKKCQCQQSVHLRLLVRQSLGRAEMTLRSRRDVSRRSRRSTRKPRTREPEERPQRV